MRTTSSTSALWRQGGVASTDIASLVNCNLRDDENVLIKFGAKLWIKDRPMRKIADLEQGSKEWLAARMTGCGATEAASMVGCSYRDMLKPHQVWEEKTGAVVVESFENEHMKRGKRLEPIARELYEDLYGWKVPPLNVLHDDYDFVRASLDGIRDDDKLIVEIKACQQTNHDKFLKLQAVSDPLERQKLLAFYFNYYRMQILYQLLITGASVAHFCGYNEEYKDHRKLAVVEVYPELKTQEILLNRVKEFWKCVEERTPPDPEWCSYKAGLPEEILHPSKGLIR